MTAATATATPRPAAARAQPMNAHAPATVALTLLTVVTAISMCRVFPDWAYLRPMLVVCIGVHAVMCLFRVLGVNAWLALPAGLVALAILIGLIYFRDSTTLGIPTGETVDQFRISLRLVWQQFPRAVSPVPSEGSFAIVATTALALAAWLADSFAFRAYGRAEAVVPTGVIFIFTSALGINRNRVPVAALWVGAAILTIAALRMAHARDDSAWMGKRRQSLWSALPAAVACALFATTGAVAVAPQLPGAGAKALLDTRNRGEGDATEVVSPLVDIRSRLVNRGNVELFTVATDTPRYLALTALGQFDGTRWSTLPEDTRPAQGTLGQAQPNAELVTQRITIKKLGGPLAPAARTATSAAWQGRTLLWANEAGALYVDGGLQPGYQYQVTSADNDPTSDQLRGATVQAAPDPIYYDLPSNIPNEVRTLAQDVTAQATTPYDKARALQDWFRSTFQYSLTVQRGHSNDAMLNFLSIKKGYCEQFSGTFAAMARAIGLPTRVMVGFTQGILRSDNLYHVAGRHAHAWDEVWFDGYGWVLFDPTPGRGAPGAEGHTGAAAAQETGNGTAGGNADNTPTPTLQPPSVAPPRPELGARPGASTPPNPTLSTTSDEGSSGGWIIMALLLAVIAWVVVMPRVLKRWSRHKARAPAERVTSAWAATVRSLTMAGAPRVAGATPMEYARTVDVGRAETVEIARLVTRAVYSPRGVDASAAERSELLRTEVDAACRARMSLTTRILDHLDPRSAWGRITG
ncbi:MAG TPA: transglutaminaseTgpA domain-containing protein [Ilumatobacteraceae bacterium]|nr:transglutaminaseTgpA domain-containing protein [Ilumatobacteraceae bacterium]